MIFSTNHLRVFPRGIRHFTGSATRRSPPAFVFDIDGVLLRGEDVLEPARNAFKILHGDNPFKRKIPYIFLTNGGGVSEGRRCADLSKHFGFQVSPSQYIQSHTILKSVSHNYVDKPALVLGGLRDVMKQVILGYGFNEVYTPSDILAWNNAIYPWHKLTPEERSSTVYPIPDFSNIKFQAIFVCHDPRNWGLDIQIMCDILLGNGYITGIPLISSSSSANQTDVDVIFCNPDLVWKNEFDVPRLGQGGFKIAWQAVWEKLRGEREDPRVMQFGKPSTETYLFASYVLKSVMETLGCELQQVSEEDSERPSMLSNVYMIGDNPESDIIGANRAKWNSILVHTGVYQPQTYPAEKLNGLRKPTWHAYDVESAVRLAIDQELRKEQASAHRHS